MFSSSAGTAPGLLPQRRGPELERAGGDAGLAATRVLIRGQRSHFAQICTLAFSEFKHARSPFFIVSTNHTEHFADIRIVTASKARARSACRTDVRGNNYMHVPQARLLRAGRAVQRRQRHLSSIVQQARGRALGGHCGRGRITGRYADSPLNHRSFGFIPWRPLEYSGAASPLAARLSRRRAPACCLATCSAWAALGSNVAIHSHIASCQTDSQPLLL